MMELQAEERILEVERRHWFTMFLEVVKFGLGIAVAFSLPVIVRLTTPDFFLAYQDFFFLGSALLAELCWIFLFIQVADYYLDVWIITNQRLILIELQGLFNRTLTSVDFKNIQDVSSHLVGLIPMILKYGDVTIQSAGTRGEFVFKQVPDPEAAKERILKACREAGRLGGF
jgi:uncharacterized membrane protein YdbT with pleckstrin-like domain